MNDEERTRVVREVHRCSWSIELAELAVLALEWDDDPGSPDLRLALSEAVGDLRAKLSRQRKADAKLTQSDGGE